jgi:hypothetical protein
VKIKGTCRRDGREFLIEQVLENGGRCPWDGLPLQADYAATLVETLRDAQEAGNVLEEALDRIADLHPAFVLNEESVLASFRASLKRLGESPVHPTERAG